MSRTNKKRCVIEEVFLSGPILREIRAIRHLRQIGRNIHRKNYIVFDYLSFHQIKGIRKDIPDAGWTVLFLLITGKRKQIIHNLCNTSLPMHIFLCMNAKNCQMRGGKRGFLDHLFVFRPNSIVLDKIVLRCIPSLSAAFFLLPSTLSRISEM